MAKPGGGGGAGAWKIFDTIHTYTIGSGQDFATLAAAASALSRLILVASPTVQLQENITLASDVTFKGLISAGGALILDLNGYTISINDGCNSGIIGNGPFEFIIQSKNGASSIVMIAASTNPPYYMVSGENGCLLNLIGATSGNTLALDAANKVIIAPAHLTKAHGRFYHLVYSNIGNCGEGGVYATEVSYGGFIGVDPAAMTADRGAILVKTDGTVVTT